MSTNNLSGDITKTNNSSGDITKTKGYTLLVGSIAGIMLYVGYQGHLDSLARQKSIAEKVKQWQENILVILKRPEHTGKSLIVGPHFTDKNSIEFTLESPSGVRHEFKCAGSGATCTITTKETVKDILE